MPRTRQITQILPVNLDNEDVCTLVSIVPFFISEFKPGIYPGRFVIDPCLDSNKPNTLLVGPSVHFIPQFNGDDEMPAVVIKTSCTDISKSILDDYMKGQMDITPDCCPGLIYLRGKIESQEFMEKHKLLHIEMKKKQFKWFGKLVDRADNDWNRYKRHTVVSDNQRFAAKVLGLKKDWLTQTDSNVVPVKCPGCLTNCSPEAVVCAVCRCILNKEKYDTLNFAA